MNKVILISAIIIIGILIGYLSIPFLFPEKFLGNEIYKKAYDFELVNIDGKIVKLSDFKGKVLAISFVYTHCPDVCHVIISRFVEIRNTLIEKGYSNFALILISVDFEGDTPEYVKQYYKERNVPDDIYYLLGKNLENLKKVWYEYGVYVATTTPQNSTNPIVVHSVVVYLIDKEGYIRVTFGNILSWSPKDVVHDMEILLKR